MGKVKKTYWVDCYHTILGEPKDKRKLGQEIKDKISTISLSTVGKYHLGIQEISHQSIEVCIHSVSDDFIVGEIRKYRDDFLMIANKLSQTEKELELEKDESLMEVNQFILVLNRNILIFQVKKEACTATQLGRYLGIFLGHETVTCNKILRKDVYERLEKGNNLTRKFEYSVARPENLDAYSTNNPWSEHALQAFALDDAANSVQVTVSIGRKGAREGKFMNIFSGIKAVMNLQPTSARVVTEDQEIIDLLEDQIRGKIQVSADNLGDYRSQVHEEMKKFWGSQEEEVGIMLGHKTG